MYMSFTFYPFYMNWLFIVLKYCELLMRLELFVLICIHSLLTNLQLSWRNSRWSEAFVGLLVVEPPVGPCIESVCLSNCRSCAGDGCDLHLINCFLISLEHNFHSCFQHVFSFLLGHAFLPYSAKDSSKIVVTETSCNPITCELGAEMVWLSQGNFASFLVDSTDYECYPERITL